MKNFWKRGFALFLAMILVLALSAPALAEEPSEPEQTEEPLPAEEPAPTEEPKLLIGGEDADREAEDDPCVELYVSREGDDEKGSGSQAAPFASLARAAEEANKTPEQPVLILVLTDLEAKRVARFTGRDVTIQAAEKPVTVTRAEGFEPDKDKDGGWYNPAMIELRTPENSKLTAGRLSLVKVILDDAGRYEGSLFETAQEPAPAEQPAEAEETEQPEESAEAQETEPAAAQDAAAPAEEENGTSAPADHRDVPDLGTLGGDAMPDFPIDGECSTNAIATAHKELRASGLILGQEHLGCKQRADIVFHHGWDPGQSFKLLAQGVVGFGQSSKTVANYASILRCDAAYSKAKTYNALPFNMVFLRQL